MYSDGGARGNPGPMGVGFIIKKLKIKDENDSLKLENDQIQSDEYETIYEYGEYIGEGTNNQAEYEALLRGLNWLVENINEFDTIECRLDSELVVKQLNGEYRVKNVDLMGKYNQILGIVGGMKGKVRFSHIQREQNKRADYLVNLALDKHVKEGK